MNKRQRKKSISKFYNSGAKLTASDKKYLSTYFGVKIIMSGQEINAAMKQIGKVIIRVINNFTPMIKNAIANLGSLSEEINDPTQKP